MYELGFMSPIIILIVAVVALVKSGYEESRFNKEIQDAIQRNYDYIMKKNR